MLINHQQLSFDIFTVGIIFFLIVQTLFLSCCIYIYINSQKLSDVSPVDTHCGHFCAAVLVELVATCLATETI